MYSYRIHGLLGDDLANFVSPPNFSNVITAL